MVNSGSTRHVTGGKGPKVSDELESCTQVTASYSTVIGGRTVILLDTPGFDDTHRGDADILAQIAETLSVAYKNEVKISGVVYLHRIKDEKMTNGIMRNLTLFRKLCGEEAFKNVVLATTFWDEQIDKEKGERRENRLISERTYWGYMTSKGSKVRRFLNTRQSALDILTEVADLPPVVLTIQREMVDEGLEVNQTKAGEALNKELAELAAKHTEQLKKLQEDMEQAIKDRDEDLQAAIKELQDEKRDMVHKLENELEALQADRQEEIRALEQKFNDQLYRVEQERREREAELEELETRMAQERLDANERLQEAMARSNNLVTRLTAEMTKARNEDKARYDESLRDLKSQQDKTAAETLKWQREVAVANDKIAELTLMQNLATRRGDWNEKEELERRIRDLEMQKLHSDTGFWDFMGGLADTALSIGVMLHEQRNSSDRT